MLTLALVSSFSSHISISCDAHLLHAQLTMLSWLFVRILLLIFENQRLITFYCRWFLCDKLNCALTRARPNSLLRTPTPALLWQHTSLYDDFSDWNAQVDSFSLCLFCSFRSCCAVANSLCRFTFFLRCISVLVKVRFQINSIKSNNFYKFVAH